jgi:hypothetical protein
MLRVKESYYFSDAHLKEMTFEDKRSLLQDIFSGTDSESNRFGVYVEKKSKELWVYTIKGLFIEEVGRLDKDRQNRLSKCNAYYSLGFYQRR